MTITITTASPSSQETQDMQKTSTDPRSIDTGSEELPALEMVGPMLGFPDHRHFALVPQDEAGAVFDLRSLEDADLRFVVVPPTIFFSDYAPEVPDATAELLQAESAEDLLALVVVTLGQGLADATANLVAPVVVNHRKRLAAQVVLDDQALSLRTPLVPDHAPEL
jgi:flagellar assembly factor FliW